MKVTVRFFGQIQHAAGRAEETVELDSPRPVGEVVRRLAEERGDPLRRHLLDEEGQLRRSLLLVVGEEQVAAESGSPLRDGDVVTLLPPISGG